MIATTSSLFVLEDVSRDFYQHFLREMDRAGRRPRVNYDDDCLEVMWRTNAHEQGKALIARLIEAYALKAEIPLTGMGSPCLQSRRRREGCNPDECYFVISPAPNFSADVETSDCPPPDLAIEVCVMPGAMDRLPALHAIGVREVWRFDGKSVNVLVRQGRGKYQSVARSTMLPDLSLDALNRFARRARRTSQGEAVLAFHHWLCEKD